MKLNHKFVDFNSNSSEVTLRIMKNTWKFTKKKRKYWNFLTLEKLEPYILLVLLCVQKIHEDTI